MNSIMKVAKSPIGSSEVFAVNARDLHKVLGIGKDFSTWIKDRVERFDFVSGEDFEVFTKYGENILGGRPQTEYIISISMAKEISMVENNEAGKVARKYFIECERKIQAGLFGLPDFTNPVEAARAWADKAEQLQVVEAKLESVQPQVALAEAITASSTSISMSEMSTLIQQSGKEMGRNRLLKILREAGYLGKYGSMRNMPTQKAMNLGLFEIDEKIGSSGQIFRTTKVTGKGQSYFISRFNGHRNRQRRPIEGPQRMVHA